MSNPNKRPLSEGDKQRPKKARQNETQEERHLSTATEADVGIIESISLRNFMCHSKLDFSFGPNVNFICGQNGSGKSAILTALVLGLGGKANITSRGSNIKGFIKTGKNTAHIKIELRNKGSDAYKPHLYGEKIIIERRLSTDGTSQYKTRSLRNAVVATKKEEINNIIDRFNIQVGNPVTVLNQETSRNFLNSKSPQDKYVFFLKATQLDEIKNNYESACEKKTSAKSLLEQKRQMLPILKKEMKRREQIYRNYMCLGEQRNKVKELRREFSWAIVYEKKRDRDGYKKVLDTEESLVAKGIEKVQQLKEKIEQCKSERNRFKAKVDDINKQIHEQTPLLEEKKNLKKSVKDKHRNITINEHKVKTEMNTIKKELKTVTDRIEELKSQDENHHLEEKRIRLQQMEHHETQRNELLAQQKTTENHFQQLEQSISHFQQELSNIKQEEQALNSRLRNLSTELQNLESSRSNRVMRFGGWMPRLLDQIEKAYQSKQFLQKPRGPIGMHTLLKDPKWAPAVETCLRSLLSAFCCDNHKDEQVLLNIFRQNVPAGRNPAIIVSKFLKERHNVRSTAVQSRDYPSVLDVLDIDDHVVANCCIDQRCIESIILIQDNATARNIMMKAVPRNCQEAFTLNADQLYPSPNFRYYSSRNNRAQFLTENVEDKIIETKNELDRLTLENRKIVATLNSAKKNLDSNRKEKSSTETNLNKILQNLQKLNSEINRLRNIEEPEPTDITVLEEDVVQQHEKLQALQSQLDTIQQSIEAVETEWQKVDDEYKTLNNQLADISRSIEPLAEKIQGCDEKFEKNKEIHQNIVKKLKENEQKVKAAKAELEKSIKEIIGLKEMALKVGPEIETNRASSQVENELKEIEKQIQNKEKQTGDKEHITVQYAEAKEKYQDVTHHIEHIEQVLTSIDRGLMKRKRAYKAFRTSTETRLKVLFQTALMIRNYTGKLEFDHSQKSLDILVHPTESAKDLHHDMRSLSGGERSFSTVCFIIALWDAMECPFRILDEYDVFMDMVNRRISMGLMMDTARQNQRHQFIFLTPLDMPITESGPLTSICMMPNPERDDA